jgi:hypothetical protein
MDGRPSSKMIDRPRSFPRRIGWILLGGLVGLAAMGRSARAQEEPAPSSTAAAEPSSPPAESGATGEATRQPTVFHVPPSSHEADELLEITATVAEAWQLEQLDVVYRRLDREGWMRVPFQQTTTGDFVAVIPALDVAAPAIEYYIESLDREGRTRRHFASPERPHRVEVVGMTSAQEESMEEQRFLGRHRFAVRTDWSSFGNRSHIGWVRDPSAYDEAETKERADDYWQLHADYSYRLLGIVQAIHFGFGVLRGNAPGLEYRYEQDPENIPSREQAPGFNYGWTGITFQFHRYFGMGVDVFLGATQLGFDGGAGTFLRIGHTAETHFDLAFDYVTNVGYRASFSFTWDTVPYVPMSLCAEFTDWPNPEDDHGDGVRLWYAAAAHVWRGLIIDARVGYAARHGSNTGGPIVGGGVAYEF